MNDHSATSSATPADHPELVRRLEALGQTTTYDIDAAWDTIQTRIATGRPTGGDRRFPPRLLLAAAVVAMVLAAAALVTTSRGDGDGRDGDRVQTADHSSDDDDSPSRRRPRRTPTSTTPTGREAPSQPGAAAGSPGRGRGPASANPAAGTASSPDAGAPGSPGGPGSGPDGGPKNPPAPIPPPSGPPIGPDTPLSRDGIGPITAGMTLHQAEQAAGVTFNAYDNGACTHAGVNLDGTGVNILVDDVDDPAADVKDRVIRSVYTTIGRTEEGVALGDPVSKLDEIYGPPTRIYPDWTAGPGTELRVYASGAYAYAAMTDGGSVTWLESGDANWVGVGGPDGCIWP